MQGFDSPAGSPQEWGFTNMNTTNYKLEKGDTVRVTGCHGRLFSALGSKRELADGVELGVECVLISGEDDTLDVELPKGILADGNHYIHISCVELVKKGERKATIEVIDKYSVINVADSNGTHYLAKIWYEDIPQGVAESVARVIKEAYDSKH